MTHQEKQHLVDIKLDYSEFLEGLAFEIIIKNEVGIGWQVS